MIGDRQPLAHRRFLGDVQPAPLALLQGHEPVVSVLGGGDPAVGATVTLAGAISASDYNKTPDSITAEVFMSADANLGSDTLQVGATWPYTLLAADETKYVLAKVTATYAGDSDVVTWSNLVGPITAEEEFTQDPRPEAQEWLAEQEESDATHFIARITTPGLATVEAAQFTNVAVGQPPSSYLDTGDPNDPGWESLEADAGDWLIPVANQKLKIGGSYANLGFRYKADTLNPQYSLAAPNRLNVFWTDPQTETRWYNLAMRTPEEYSQYGIGEPVQEGTQWFRSWDQVGDQVYLAHDVGGIWESSNDALLIRPVRGSGLYASGAQSICIDPSFPDKFWHVGLDSENANTTAIYFSDDKGATASISYSIPSSWHANGRNTGIFWANKNIAVDPTTTAGATSLRRVYAVIQKMSIPAGESKYFPDGAQVLTREPSGGDTWTTRATLTQATHGNIYGLFPHPTKAGTVYMTTSTGLWKSINTGAGFTKLSGTKGIPAGTVREIWIDPDSPSSGNEDVIIFGVQTQGVYKTTNSFSTNVTVLKSEPTVVRVVVSTVDPNYIFIITNDNNDPWYSHLGGATGSWFRSNCVGRPGSSAQARIGGASAGYAHMSFIAPHPTDKLKAWAHGGNILFRTTDGGVTWNCWADGFTGVKLGGGGGHPIGFDVSNPQRFIAAVADFSCAANDTNMNSFEHRKCPNTFTTQETQSALSGGMEPTAGSDIIIVTLGRTGASTGAIARSPDLGVNWFKVDSTKCWTFLWDRADTDFVYAGSRRSTDKGLTWGNAGRTVCGLSADGLTVWGVNLGTDTTTISKATNGHSGTLSWTDIVTFPFRMYASVTGSPAVMGLQFFPPFASHPTLGTRFYTITSGGEIVRYDGTTPTNPATGPLALAGGRNPEPGLDLDNGVVNICVDPQNPEIVYAFLKQTGLPWCYMSTDHGATWEDITENIPLYGAGGSGGQQVHPLTGELMVGYYLGTRVRRPPVGFSYSHSPISVSAQLKILH